MTTCDAKQSIIMSLNYKKKTDFHFIVSSIELYFGEKQIILKGVLRDF